MAGSHSARRRAPAQRPGRPTRRKAPPRLSRRTWATAVAIALLPALWLGGQRLLDGGDRPGVRSNAPIPDVTSTRLPSTSPTGTPSSTPTGTPPSTASPATSALPRVPASGPRRLIVPGLLDVGFDDSIEVTDGGFKAGSTAEAARWGSRGTPSSPGSDTVVVVGKVYRRSASAFDALPRVSAGDRVTVRTQNADVLTYTVQSSAPVPADGLLQRPELTAKVPGRLVLVGILFDSTDDARTGQYLVVVAQLSGARRG